MVDNMYVQLLDDLIFQYVIRFFICSCALYIFEPILKKQCVQQSTIPTKFEKYEMIFLSEKLCLLSMIFSSNVSIHILL